MTGTVRHGPAGAAADRLRQAEVEGEGELQGPEAEVQGAVEVPGGETLAEVRARHIREIRAAEDRRDDMDAASAFSEEGLSALAQALELVETIKRQIETLQDVRDAEVMALELLRELPLEEWRKNQLIWLAKSIGHTDVPSRFNKDDLVALIRGPLEGEDEGSKGGVAGVGDEEGEEREGDEEEES